MVRQHRLAERLLTEIIGLPWPTLRFVAGISDDIEHRLADDVRRSAPARTGHREAGDRPWPTAPLRAVPADLPAEACPGPSGPWNDAVAPGGAGHRGLGTARSNCPKPTSWPAPTRTTATATASRPNRIGIAPLSGSSLAGSGDRPTGRSSPNRLAVPGEGRERPGRRPPKVSGVRLTTLNLLGKPKIRGRRSRYASQ